MNTLREVPHIEIRKTDIRTMLDVDIRTSITPAVKLLRDILGGKEQESFVILVVSGTGRVTAWREVARGREGSVEVPVRALFRTALMADASFVILSHNHPSGNPTPSPQDDVLTAKLRLAGDMINVPILDHIIIGDGERYYSYRDGEAKTTATLNVSGDRQPPEL